MNDPQRLIDAYIDGTLDDASFAELCDWLRVDVAHRRDFARALALHSGIADWANDHSGRVLFSDLSSGSDDAETPNPNWIEAIAQLDDVTETVSPVDLTAEWKLRESAQRQQDRRARLADQRRQSMGANAGRRSPALHRGAVWVGIAAAIVLAAWFGWPSGPDQPATSSTQKPPAAQVAYIRNVVDARWSNQAYGLHRPLYANTAVTLMSGSAEITFDDGVSVIVQGPATFEASTANSMRLLSGRIVARVQDDENQFSVHTRAGVLVDHVGEFGASVDAEGNLQTHVFQGHATFTPHSGTSDQPPNPLALQGGEALLSSAAGSHRMIPLQAQDFVREEEFFARIMAPTSPYARWLAYTYELKRDPSLVAMYLFDKSDELARVLRNQAPGLDNALAGDIRGEGGMPVWSTGRIPGKRSLQFDADRQQCIVIDDWPAYVPSRAMTLSVWFRANPVQEDWNVILSQWGLGFSPDCRFHLGVLGRDTDGNAPAADQRVCLHIWSNGGQYLKDQANGGGSLPRNGEWVNATFTITAPGEARLYINGQEVDKALLPYAERTLGGSDQPLVLGGKADRTLFFTGDIDELMIFGRAMSPREVEELYNAGRPEAETP